MKNIVLTACLLLLTGTVSDVRADEGGATVKGFIGNKTTSESYKIGNAAPGTGFKVSTRPTSNWNLEIAVAENEESERRLEKDVKDDEPISYTITTTLTNANDKKQTKTWEWKDLRQTPDSSSYNVAYCIAESDSPDACLAPIVNRNMTLKIKSNKKDKDFPFDISGEFNDCGGSCRFSSDEE